MATNGSTNTRAIKHFPLAIVGIGLRFPGNVDTTEKFWKLLVDGTDAIVEIPKDRWTMDFHNPDQKVAGKHTTRRAGFSENIDKFDAAFFGISPREARSMDPQQRKLLQVTWEAFEDAGIIPSSLSETNTGVFVGIGMMDYFLMQMEPEQISGYTTTGIAHSVAANRLSYFFGLKGPSLAVDTACAASLTALHYGAMSIWNGESDVAVVSGANVLLTPGTTIGFSQLGVLAPDGRCKSFDANANGYVRGEGFATVIVKPLDVAMRDGDHIYCSILGSGINHNGKTDSITMPSGEAQQELARWMFDRYEIDPRSVRYVEAHGTGTPVGDPIEGNAIGQAYGATKERKRPVKVGSVKTNLGHLECAAGMAGMIKVALMLEEGHYVPIVNYTGEPNHKLDMSYIDIQNKYEPFEKIEGEDQVICAVHSFGFGGANAMTIMQQVDEKQKEFAQNGNGHSAGAAEFAGWSISSISSMDVDGAPDKASVLAAQNKPTLFTFSARSSGALQGVAGQYAKFESGADALAVAKFLATRRTHHIPHRLAVVANSAEDLRSKLQAFVNGKTVAGVSAAQTKHGEVKVGFVFSGQGPQHLEMGRVLFNDNKIFRDTILQMDNMFKKLSGYSLVDKGFFKGATPKGMTEDVFYDPQITQPALVFLQIALYRVLSSQYGITPAVIVGHSIGEVAAAYACGAITIEDAVLVVYQRSSNQAYIPSGKGKMLAVGWGVEKATAMLLGPESDGKAWIAAVNSPQSVTIGGDSEYLEKVLVEKCTKAGVFNALLKVSHAFHTPQMEPAKERFMSAMAKFKTSNAVPKIPVFSTVTGKEYTIPYDAEYWWSNVREAVLFHPAAQKAFAGVVDLVLEVAPHPVLTPSLKQFLDTSTTSIVCTLSRRSEERSTFLSSIGQLYAAGTSIDWDKAYANVPTQFIKLPLYPWNEERYWQEPEELMAKRLGTGDKSLMANGGIIQMNRYPFLEDHVVENIVVFPGAGYVELVLENFCKNDEVIILEDVKFVKALFWPESNKIQFQVTRNGNYFEVSTLLEGKTSLHMSGNIGDAKNVPAAGQLNIAELRKLNTEHIPKKETYQYFAEKSFQYGPLFQVLEEVWKGDGEALGIIQPPPDDSQKFYVTFLDGCLQLTIITSDSSNTYLPVSIGKLVIYSNLSGSKLKDQTLYAYARQSDFEGLLFLKGDVFLTNADGVVLAALYNFVGQCVNFKTEVNVQDCVYTREWQPKSPHLPPPSQVKGLRELFTGHEWAEELRLIAGVEKKKADIDAVVSGYVHFALQEVEAGRVTPSPKLNQYMAVLNAVIAEVGGKAAFKGLTKETLANKYSQLLADIPQFKAELSIMQAICSILPAVLQDPMAAIPVLYAPEGLGQFFEDSLSMRMFYKWIARAVKFTVDKILAQPGNEGRVIRIIETGARGGGLSVHVVPLLAEYGKQRKIEYVFADLNTAMFTAAQKKLAEYTFVHYQQIDIERKASEQHFVNGAYDIVIAMNTLHATARIDKALQTMHDLLVPGGWLIISDPTNSPKFTDLIFGCLDLWWSFSDFRTANNHCCLTRSQWKDFLTSYNFADTVDVSSPTEFINTLFITHKKPVPALTLVQHPEKGVFGDYKTPTEWVVFVDEEEESVARKFIENVGEKHVKLQFERRTHKEDATKRQRQAPWTERFKEYLVENKARWQAASERPALLYCWGYHHSLDPQVGQNSAADLHRLILLLHNEELLGTVTLYAVTQGALVDCACPSAALTTGTLRTAVNEMQDFDVTVIDVEHGAPVSAQLNHIYDVIAGNWGKETEISFRKGDSFVFRLIHGHYKLKQQHELPAPSSSSSSASSSKPAAVASKPQFQMALAEAGNLESLGFSAVQKTDLPADHIRVKVRGAGLNFKDLMYSLNLLNDLKKHSKEEYQLGHEFSGVVEEVGSAVKSLKVGDEVMGMLPHGGAFASHVVCLDKHAVIKPANLSFTQAGGACIAYATAYHALINVGQLKKGETVLIHSAAGGVGQAAIRIAHMTGATVIATAGSESRRKFLKDTFGVAAVADSHSSASFVQVVKSFTKERGVDVILNSLSGEAIAAGISVLAFGGRFVEIGKRDILENSKLDMINFLMNKSFVSVHIDMMLEHAPEMIHSLISRVAELIKTKVLPAPETTAYPLESAKEALRLMQNNQHRGKIVLELEPNYYPAECKPSQNIFVKSGGAYLVTGGLGGVGMSVAVFMAEAGVKNIILMGRNPPSSPKNLRMLSKIRALGANCTVFLGDVSKMEDCKRAFEEAHSKGLHIKGIWHFALNLEDNFIVRMTTEEFVRAFPAKVGGAFNLHNLTLNYPHLDFFIMASSVCGVFGNLEQANYVAAVNYLDSLAEHRKQRGLKGLAVQLGGIRGAGILERSRNILRIFNQRGFETLHVSEIVSMFQMFIQNQEQGVIMCANHNWSIIAPAMKDNCRVGHNWVKSMARGALAANLSPEQIIATSLKQLADMLFVDVASLSEDQPLISYGVDSLISVELVNWFKQKLNITVSQMDIFSGLSLKALLADVLAEAASGGGGGGGGAATDMEVSAKEESEMEKIAKDVQEIIKEIDFTKCKPIANNTNPSPSSVFISGATGYFGAHVLHHFLESTNATVHCLVRAQSDADAFARIEKQLKEQHAWDESKKVAWTKRIKAHAGDLAQPGLGLASTEWFSEVEKVYHIGANVNWIIPYNQLRAPNVMGTVEILKLVANTGKLIPCHIISTLAVVGIGASHLDSMFAEMGGYAQTKWASEQISKHARSQGLPVGIYRFPLASPHSKTGACNMEDVFIRTIVSSVETKTLPALDKKVHQVPFQALTVDNLTRGIVGLSCKESTFGRDVIQFATTSGPNWCDVFEILRKSLPVTEVPLAQWVDVINAHPTTAVAPIINIVKMQLTMGEVFTPELVYKQLDPSCVETNQWEFGPEMVDKIVRFAIKNQIQK